MATEKKNAGGEISDMVTKEVKKTVEELVKTTVEELTKPAAETIQTKATVKKAPTVAKRSAAKFEVQPDAEESIESAIGRTEQFIYNNGKALLTALAVILLIVGGFLAYKYFYLSHRTEKAGEMMYVAEQQFAVDSFSLALLGDGNNSGFLSVVEKFGSTPEGNIAKHYAGVCYLKLGDMDNALLYLGKYSTTKGAPNALINAQNLGLQGDILVQKGEYEKAAQMYVQAVAQSDNSFTTPMYLKKMAQVYDKLGKHKQAETALQRIADEFSMEPEGRDMEKYIGQQEQLQ